MKILFICRQNVGRSQAAMELFRLKGGIAESAGTAVENPNTTLAERPGAVNIVAVMRQDYGVDMNKNIRKQLTESGPVFGVQRPAVPGLQPLQFANVVSGRGHGPRTYASSPCPRAAEPTFLAGGR